MLQMPSLFGKAKKQAELIEALPQVFRSVMKKWGLAAGDFPDIHDFQVLDKELLADFVRANKSFCKTVCGFGSVVKTNYKQDF